MACSVCYLAKSFILHQISVGITAIRGQGFVLTTKQNKKIWFLLFWLAWKICRIWTTFVRSVNQAWGCQMLSWPAYWDTNVKTLACQMPRPQNTLRTWQGWRLLPDLPFVVGPLHLFFSHHFWHANLRSGEEFYQLPPLCSTCCNSSRPPRSAFCFE